MGPFQGRPLLRATMIQLICKQTMTEMKSLSFHLVDLVDFKPTVGPKVNHLKAK